LPEPLPAAGETARQRFFEAVARFLVALSAPGPLLIVLEDLHWATESTLQLLHYLTRHLADRPVLLVGTFRSEMVRPAHPLLALQHQLTQAGLAHTLHLAPLSAEAVESLVATLSGAGDVVMPLARRLYQETEGNPFFLMETVKMLFETDVLRLEEAAWRGDFARLSTRAFPLPPSVSEAIQSRVRRLGAATQKALGRAAVLGREFDFDLLHAVWGQDEETTLEALDDLLRHRLIDEGAGALGRDYAFTHHKIQEAVYAALPRRRRQHVHARAGAVLERLYGPPAEAQAGELAYHFGRAEIHDKAISYLIQAGDYARQSYACVEACQHYTSALELAERAAWPETNLTVATIHERRGQARAAVVDMGGARRDLYWVVEWARRVGDQHKEAETLLNLIEPLLVGHQVDEAFTCAREAYALADTLQDHHLIAGSTGAIGSALCVKGALDEAHDYLQTALTAAREHGAREILSGILFYCALARYWMADFRGALALVDEGQALAEELHDPSRAIGMGLVGALTWCSLGEYDTALRYLAEADELARKAQVATAPAELLNTRGWVHQEIYNLERSTRLNQECTVVARELGEIESEANAWVNLGVDHLWSGNLDRAEACFTEAWGLLDKQFGGFRWRWKTRLFAAWGELYLYRGEATRALDYAEQCLTLAGQTSARKNLVKGWKLKGEALTALGRLDEAAAWLRQAIALAGDIGNPPLAWKSRYALGRVLERQGQSAAAQRQYQQAAVAIERTAADLSDPALRETFLQAGPVRTVLDAAGCSRL
jgi:tetratricopeptide (TPR) repeat protein